MPSHASESLLYGASFSTPEFLEVFNDEMRVQAWFDVEVALAKAQAELEVIPLDASVEIAKKAKAENVDIAAIGRGISETAHPIVPAIRALEEICDNGAGEFIHYGATTQDIMDTGLILQIKKVWPLILRDLKAARDALAELAREHRSTSMVGRTHGQQALPLTFGYKCAVWVDEIGRHLERCSEAEPRVFSGNITGAVGTMAAFGEKGQEIQKRALQYLELSVPNICWHSSRDRICELANLLTQISATLGKIAREIYALQQVEFGEVAEPHHHGKVGSSTMPHKRNPATVELAIGLSRLIRAQQIAITDAAFQEHERYSALLRIELAAVPEMMIYSGALLAKMRGVLERLEVYPKRMRKNLDLLGGLLLSEKVMLSLGKAIGKQTAHEIVYEIAMKSYEEAKPFSDALIADPVVSEHLTPSKIKELLDPEGYIGESEKIVDKVLENIKLE
ncbi:MAG: adenylosuccinate lyase [Rhodospirillaceae bacterium]|nr:adenylosuccinate lyase [Rhodospirillaceae bacterium]|tara:strand:- start:430 stop:1782 length:1353 start_codon:yes stop_codon:yes gene_type:complete